MSDGGAQAPSACWNCRQPLTAGASRCIWCGVTLTAAAAPLVVAPAAVAAAVSAAAVAVAPAPAVPGMPQPTPAPERAAGAGAAARLVALTVDLVLLAVIGAAAFVLTRHAALSGAILVEALLLLWILDARTGATPGKALVRLRSALPGGVRSPGAGRSFGRGALTGAGLLVGGVGAWVVAASAAFDPWRRSWADRVTGTVTVAVPATARLPIPSAPPAPAAAPGPRAPIIAGDAAASSPLPPAPVTLGAPPVLPPLPTAAAPAIAEPRVVSVATPRPAIDEESASDAVAAWAAEVAVAPAAPPPAEEAAASVLLVFDTGQRVTLPSPVAVNLGRNPTPTAEGDRLVAVDDPDSTVSKTHARFEHSRGATWITDGGSTNGTEVLSADGGAVPLAPGVRTLLEEGDRVRLGRRVFTVSVVLNGGAG